MVKISAVIITKNEGNNIVRCLQSLQGVVDEIIVVDSFSTDNTKEICLSYGVRFFEQEWLGYGEQKNLGNSKATYDYILSLDADEALSSKLRESILAVKENWTHDGYSFNRLNIYCGKLIKHCGWYPDKKIRLWDRRKGQWATPLVHETVKLQKGSTSKRLKGDLFHHTYQTIDEHLQSTSRYTTLAAEEYLRKGTKARFTKLYLSPIFVFFRDYFFKLGFLDGFYGYTICKIVAFNTYLKYAKLKRLTEEGHPSVSLVITTYNRVDALDLVLHSVTKQSIFPTEVIVADDGSLDDTRDLVVKYQQTFPIPLVHCWHEDDGFRLSSIRNKAIAMAKGNYIVMVDGDMVLHKHFIRDHKGIVKENQFIQGRRVFLKKAAADEALGFKRTRFSFLAKEIKNRFNAVCCKFLSPLVSNLFSRSDHQSVRGCNMAFWRDDVIKVNGFNEEFTGWGREDSEFVVRMLNAGIRRKDLRLGGVAYHLYHPERSTDRLDVNHKMFEEALENKITNCKVGISQYL